MVVKGLVFLLFAACFLVGCVEDHVRISPPSFDLAFGKTELIRKAVAVIQAGPLTPAQSDAASDAVRQVDALKTDLETVKQTADTQASQLAAAATRLNYLEPAYSSLLGKVWRWRLLAGGIVAAVALYFAAKFYFKLPI